MSLVDVVNSRCDIGHLCRGRSTLAASDCPLCCSCGPVHSFGTVSLLVIALFLYIFQACGPQYYTRHSSYACTTSLSLFSLPFLSHQRGNRISLPLSAILALDETPCSYFGAGMPRPLCGRPGPAPAPGPDPDPDPSQDYSGLGRVIAGGGAAGPPFGGRIALPRCRRAPVVDCRRWWAHTVCRREERRRCGP